MENTTRTFEMSQLYVPEVTFFYVSRADADSLDRAEEDRIGDRRYTEGGGGNWTTPGWYWTQGQYRPMRNREAILQGMPAEAIGPFETCTHAKINFDEQR